MFSFIRFSAPTVAFAVIQELSQVLGAVKHAGPDAKESNPPGITGSKKGDAGDA